jgi:hypothetical protein
MSKKPAAIPLKSMLEAIDTNDFEFYAKLTPDQQKEFSPWLAMRYASSAQGNTTAHYLLMVNDIVNNNFSELKNHPDLQWKLLAVCGSGRPTFHPWIPPGKGKRKTSKLKDLLHRIYPHMGYDDIDMLVAINTEDDLKQFARDSGMDEKDIKDMFK